MVSFGRIARIALVSAVICVTVGASGVLATMTWQIPGDANAAAEASAPRGTSSSLIITAAHAYVDAQAAKTALQAAPPAATAAALVPSKTKAARDNDLASFAQFERKCLKKVSKRRNAKLVHVPCSPLQDEVLASSETTPAPSARKAAKRTPSGAFARQIH